MILFYFLLLLTDFTFNSINHIYEYSSSSPQNENRKSTDYRFSEYYFIFCEKVDF